MSMQFMKRQANSIMQMKKSHHQNVSFLVAFMMDVDSDFQIDGIFCNIILPMMNNRIINRQKKIKKMEQETYNFYNNKKQYLNYHIFRTPNRILSCGCPTGSSFMQMWPQKYWLISRGTYIIVEEDQKKFLSPWIGAEESSTFRKLLY